MLSCCCPSFKYPCLYGNRSQTYTKECDFYWKGQEPVTEGIEENTIFSECTSKSNDVAQELAQYEADNSLHCASQCATYACLALDNPEDNQYLDYFSLDLGLRFSRDVTICLEILSHCGSPALPPFMRFRPLADVSPSLILNDNACGKLTGGVVYRFGFRQLGNNNFTAPQMFSLGWDCEIGCPVNKQGKYALSFPTGIAYSNGGSFL